jgi:hypothetical protein
VLLKQAVVLGYSLIQTAEGQPSRRNGTDNLTFCALGKSVEKVDVSFVSGEIHVTGRITPHLRRDIARVELGRAYLFNTDLRRAADYIRLVVQVNNFDHFSANKIATVVAWPCHSSSKVACVVVQCYASLSLVSITLAQISCSRCLDRGVISVSFHSVNAERIIFIAVFTVRNSIAACEISIAHSAPFASK